MSRQLDPDITPRKPFLAETKREKPIYAREQFGPWKCDVHVTPITGMRAGYPIFEVRAAWELGPPLDESLGPTPARGMAAVDTYYVDKAARDVMLDNAGAQELALELAKRTADLLAEAVKPDLRALARALLRRRRA